MRIRRVGRQGRSRPVLDGAMGAQTSDVVSTTTNARTLCALYTASISSERARSMTRFCIIRRAADDGPASRGKQKVLSRALSTMDYGFDRRRRDDGNE